MSIQIQLRRGTAAQWSSANPILASGEMGVETDTGQFKVGNGITAWNSLSYGGLQGPAQTNSIQSFGDGSDGDVTLSAGVTTLTKDMFYNNLTLTGAAKIATAGYRVFVKGILDISAAGAGAINADGGAGSTATIQTGGAAGTNIAAAMLGASTPGSAGATGVVGVGASSAAVTGTTPANGGAGGSSGTGGTGTSGAGGSGAVGGSVALATPIRYFTQDMIRGVTLIQGGAGGRGGGSGAGDGTNLGRGGGGGGGGGGVVVVLAKVINRGASTAAGAISALGGIGGGGANGAAGNVGGGGAGAGGGGGWVYVAYSTLTGTTATNAVAASGGDGGVGGNGIGTGTGGAGGGGGSGGRVTLYSSLDNSGSETFGSAGAAGSPSVGLTGGAAGAGNLVRVSL